MSGEQMDLAQRLLRMEDVEEIKKLKARYVAACDGGWAGTQSHDKEKILALFTEDCVWDGGVYGKREGRAALRAYYDQNSASDAPLAYHLLTNPIIDVNGDHATGNWHLTIMLLLPNGTSHLVGGIFNDEYARTAEGWRIKYSHFTLALNGSYEKAWALPSAQTPGVAT
jgi:hypothetical protein